MFSMSAVHQDETATQYTSQHGFESITFHKTTIISRPVDGDNPDDGNAEAQDLDTSLCAQPTISPPPQYRIVHGIAGRPLSRFECTKQLVTAVLDALRAHVHAFEVANILHRDISAGNIVLTDEGRGLLIDWELAKSVEEGGSRLLDRTGTWQFVSANLLQHPDKVPALTDDLESFLHVLGWTTLRYVLADETYEGDDRGEDLAMFGECDVHPGSLSRGGRSKAKALRAEGYPSLNFQPSQPTPLVQLLWDLSRPFRSLYRNPPTKDDRMRVDMPENANDDLFWLSMDICCYDMEMQQLESPSWFIDTIQRALKEDVWSTDDRGFEGQPTSRTEELAIQIRRMNEIWANSKGLPEKSKRAASSAPERCGKRRRVTSCI